MAEDESEEAKSELQDIQSEISSGITTLDDEIATRHVGRSKIFAHTLKVEWRVVVMIVWPILASLIFLVADPRRKDLMCAYVILVMAVYWVCEVLPLGITALIPVVAWPMMGICNTKDVVQVYFNQTVVLFVAGLIVALALEYSDLHRRVALKVMMCVGTTHIMLTFGFMTVTTLVSLWVSNSAAAAMMIPVVIALFEELEENKLARLFKPQTEEEALREEPYPTRTALAYFLGLAYSASMGGIGTLPATGTNLIFKGQFEKKFPKAPEIGFIKWSMFTLLPLFIMMYLAWAGLCVQYLGLWTNRGMDEETLQQKKLTKEEKKEVQKLIKVVLKQKYEDLGKWTYHQIAVGILFILIVGLWVFRSPQIFPGWSEVLTSNKDDGSPTKTNDGVPGMFVVILFFVIPASCKCINCLSPYPSKRPHKKGHGLLTWKFMKEKMPWGLILLIGGGFALAVGAEKSGLSKVLGQSFQNLKHLPPLVILLIVVIMTEHITELTSNMAVCNILLPVVLEMALILKVNPMYLAMPVTLCCSFSFMIPVGTPPNAMVAGIINIRAKDMIISGLWPTWETAAVLMLFWPTLGAVVYDMDGFPDWAENP